MPEPVVFISHFRIKEGMADAVRELTRTVVDDLRVAKPRTLLFLTYLDGDASVISFLHAFADADSMDIHTEDAGDRARAAYEFVDPVGWEIYGQPSPATLAALEQAARSTGASLRIDPNFVAGFVRMTSDNSG